MSDSRVEVLQVPPGSILWLHNIDLGDDYDAGYALDQLLQAIGHTDHVILQTNGDGVVEVLGPDELVARVRAALEAES